MKDILISDIEVKLSQFDLIMLVMGLEELPDSPEEMLNYMQESSTAEELEEVYDRNRIANTSLMVKDMVKGRLINKLAESLAEDMNKELENGLKEFEKLLKDGI